MLFAELATKRSSLKRSIYFWTRFSFFAAKKENAARWSGVHHL
jgi:hypothetical protein